ncbi:MAG: glycosyltransferase [Candidatus Dormibacteraeota bacterium]|uniref:Glycosyltransferase n=1 Tax=Candidatus Aeolococcus gillhamiae TaxID=3127015 RepID=A0A934N6W4_9BACT|nr:glycosyltransferase [Candidatus Dormibacteraeota bacterium]
MVNDVAGVALVELDILRGDGLEVDYLQLPWLGASWRRPFKLLIMPLRLAAYLPVIMRLRRGRYDLAHVHFVSQGFVSLLAGLPLVLHAHGSDLHQNFNRALMRWMGHWTLHRAKAVLYVTPNLASYISPWTSRARLLGNPVPIPERYTVPDSIKRALIFARLEPIKGVQLIFDGIEEIAQECELTAIYWGPWAEEYKHRYGHAVEFIDRVPHSAVPDVLERFDVVIGQMRQGILSLSELEAMASGRPLLTNLDQTLYADDPPPVVPVATAADIVAALRSLREDAARVKSLAELGRGWVRRNHGFAAHREGLLAAYQDVLGTTSLLGSTSGRATGLGQARSESEDIT